MGTIQFYKYKTQHARAAFLAKEMVRNALPENVVLFLFEKVYDTHLQICITSFGPSAVIPSLEAPLSSIDSS